MEFHLLNKFLQWGTQNFLDSGTPTQKEGRQVNFPQNRMEMKNICLARGGAFSFLQSLPMKLVVYSVFTSKLIC